MLLGESVLELWRAQLDIGRFSLGQLTDLPQTVTYVNPQIFVAIVAGLLMAFAFQLFLTNLGVAIGVTALGFQINRKRHEELPHADADDTSDARETSDLGDTVRTIGFAAGFGILFTINVVLFAACFLAAKLSLVTSPFVGAILGVVIWSAYFLILTWVSTTAVSSLVGTVLGSAAAGFRGIISTVSAAVKGKDDQPYMTQAAAAKAIRREVKSALNSGDIQDSLKEYVVGLQPPPIDLGTVRQEVQTLLKSPEAVSLMGGNLLKNVNRQTFVDLIRERSDLSKRDAEQVVEQLDGLWQQTVSQQAGGGKSLLDFLQSASIDELKSRFSVQPQSATSDQADSSNGFGQFLPELGEGWVGFGALDFNAIKQAVLSRVDLSELDVEQVWQQLMELRRSILGQADSSPFSTIRADVEGFLLGAYAWDLGHTLKDRFREVLHDPNAAPDLVRQQLESIAPKDFVEILQQRQDLPPEKVDQIASQLESVRQEVLETVAAEPDEPLPAPQPVTEAATELWQKLESYFRYAKVKQFTPKKVDRKLQTLLEEAAAAAPIGLILPDFDRAALENLLSRRKGMEPEQVEEILDQVAAAWQPYSVSDANSDQTRTDRLTKTIGRFLQNGLPDSQPELIERLGELGIGSWAVKALKDIDWQSIAPQALDSPQARQVQDAIYKLAKAPRRWATRTQRTAWAFGDRLQTYLQAVDVADLDLEGIRSSLTRLLHDAKQQGHQVEELLRSAFERSTLAAALLQREDLSEPEVEQVIEQIESVCALLLEEAQQEQEKEQSSFDSLLGKMRRSLSSLQLPDLDADHLKQDLYKLLDLPQAGLAMLNGAGMPDGIESIRDRLSHFNRDTLAKLMQARNDFSETVSSRVIDQVEGVRDQIMQQVEQVQLEAQRQLDDLKQQAQKRAEETRKAATIAAWWLFCTALTSLTSAAVAGIIGVGFSF